jgi:hypothetical protein
MYKKLALVVCWVLMSCSVNSAAVPAPVDAQQQCVQKVQKFMDEALKAGLSQKEAEDLWLIISGKGIQWPSDYFVA